eukprot:COSAG02_NODE_2_length_75708_cov_87.013953_6_plen_90_part_00
MYEKALWSEGGGPGRDGSPGGCGGRTSAPTSWRPFCPFWLAFCAFFYKYTVDATCVAFVSQDSIHVTGLSDSLNRVPLSVPICQCDFQN